MVVQIVIGFGDQGDRLVMPPLENRSLNRLAKRLWKLIPMVTAKDSRRFHSLRAAVSQALAVCSSLSRHRLSGAAAASSCAKTRAFTTWTPGWATEVPRLRVAAAIVDEGFLFPLGALATCMPSGLFLD